MKILKYAFVLCDDAQKVSINYILNAIFVERPHYVHQIKIGAEGGGGSNSELFWEDLIKVLINNHNPTFLFNGGWSLEWMRFRQSEMSEFQIVQRKIIKI